MYYFILHMDFLSSKRFIALSIFLLVLAQYKSLITLSFLKNYFLKLFYFITLYSNPESYSWDVILPFYIFLHLNISREYLEFIGINGTIGIFKVISRNSKEVYIKNASKFLYCFYSLR